MGPALRRKLVWPFESLIFFTRGRFYGLWQLNKFTVKPESKGARDRKKIGENPEGGFT